MVLSLSHAIIIIIINKTRERYDKMVVKFINKDFK